MTPFYYTLFGIEVTVFGIALAAIFVYIQLIYSAYPADQSSLILRSVLFGKVKSVLLILCGGISMTVVALGSLLLSLGQYDFVSRIDFNSTVLLSDSLIPAIALVTFFLTLIMFVLLMKEGIKYLSPLQVMYLVKDRINYDTFWKLLLKNKTIGKPYLYQIRGVLQEKGKEDNQETLEQSILDENLAVYKELKQSLEIVKEEEFQVTGIFDLSYQAMNKFDAKILWGLEIILLEITKEFINNIPSDKNEFWRPYNAVKSYYVEYIIDKLETLFNLASYRDNSPDKFKIIGITRSILDVLVDDERSVEIILSFWKRVADSSMGTSKDIFIEVVRNYGSFVHKLFETGKATNALEEAFRHLGWLGERLLSKNIFEEKPRMIDFEYYNEYDEILETILSFEDLFISSAGDQYPLIYFDAVSVFLEGLVKKYKQIVSIQGIDNDILSLVYVYSSFAENAIKFGNTRGAALAIIRLEESYKLLSSSNIEDSVNDCYGLLLKTGLTAASFSESHKKEEILSNMKLEDYLFNVLVNNRTRISHSQILDFYVRQYGGNYENVRLYVKKLGKEMNDNFGLNFDPSTGKDRPYK